MSNQADDRYKGLSIGERLYIALIRNARKSIKITNHYFILNQPLRSALWEASNLRGVKVEVLTNSDQSIDMPTMWKCSAQDFETALENNIQIYEYFTDEGMLHSKTAIFDGEVGIVGSFNFDSVSYDSNTEALIPSPLFVSSILPRTALLSNTVNVPSLVQNLANTTL